MFTTLLVFLSLNVFSAKSAFKFDDLRNDVQQEIISEIGVRPILISDISDLALGMDASYIGIFQKNNKTFSFHLHIYYGTQGSFGTIIKDIVEVTGLTL
jgi:hypothetical protein